MRRSLASAVLAGVPGLAQVQVTPPAVVLGSGQTCAFRATLAQAPGAVPTRSPSWARAAQDPSQWRWTLPDGGRGTLDGRGVFMAPAEGRPHRTRVRATLAGCPDIWGEAVVTSLPLPEVPVDLVGQVLGPDWASPYTAALPFMDWDTRRRPGAALPMRDTIRAQPLEVGYGLPAQLTWKPRPVSAGTLLTCRQGAETVRRDVSGQDRAVLTLNAWADLCRVESLVPDPDTAWASCVETRPLLPRGLFPWPGRPETPSAGFSEPSGLAALKPGHGPQGAALVADAGDHVLRVLDGEGEVRTWCGEPGQPGHLDSPVARSCLGRALAFLTGARKGPVRFNRPTFLTLARMAWGDMPWRLLVADSGNHVIRTVAADGTVGTLAGMPGEAGHANAADDPGLARFSTPLGLAWNRLDATLYIADQGNAAVRRLDLSGRVSTFAGQPGNPGTRDGLPRTAQFTNLKGIVLPRRLADRTRLYVLDGHAVREINLGNGRVTTRLGQVDAPGFRDFGPAPESRLVPCLNDPWDIKACHPGYLIADRGNVDPRGGTCQARFTMQGGPNDILPVAYTADFLEPDGTLAERRTGDGFTWQPIKADGVFAQSGTGTVVVRCVTHQGRSAGAKADVVIP
ncbi:hypothetical protein [Geothrix sp. 21YS21S-2]|uniref:hypothetical protein n=1 Tax=Geothrix sp. 21YS21S-2 TaxID=3068893 RepID=UPI0027BB13E8|nr:hypothetical protein [Geothrix sp. 21YS21S-2]